MNVIELINKLEELPNDANVVAIYDGFCTVSVDNVYLSKGGRVVLVNDQAVYEDEDRPEGAPLKKDDYCWTATESDNQP